MDELTYINNAKQKMTLCKMCKECNGEVCRGWTPGPGGKGSGSTFVRNISSFRQVQIKMSIIGQNIQPEISFKFFSTLLNAPIMAAPISNVKVNYGSTVDEKTYLDALVDGTLESGILSFLGDSPSKESFDLTLDTLKKVKGQAIMTIKPWEMPFLLKKLDQVLSLNPFAIAMDIDAGGLSSLRQSSPRVGFMSIDDLKIIKSRIGDIPFILKGIMTKEDALYALEAKVDAIIISNHGGRVMDAGESSLEVLEEIASVIDHRCIVLMDGGVRTGADVYKAIALGSDAVLIGRPFSHASIGSGKEGVQYLITKLSNELKDLMMMTQCRSLSDITRDKVKTHFI
jgi:4-hydroxymandelate oxidase